MGLTTKIEWCDHTFNPWIGCTKISAGCTNCYAAEFAKWRFPGTWGPNADRHRQEDGYWDRLRRWDNAAAKEGRPRLVFCGSMCDIFEASELNHVNVARSHLWQEIEIRQNLIFLLVTKRPENIVEWVPGGRLFFAPGNVTGDWLRDPPANVMYLTSIENRAVLRPRLSQLLATPAAMRGLSCEPLLEDLQLNLDLFHCTIDEAMGKETRHRHGLDWIIAGGESGKNARPCAQDWFWDLHFECVHGLIPFFMKQFGSNCWSAGGKDRVTLTHPKGGDPDEWRPEDRIRRFPPQFRR